MSVTRECHHPRGLTAGVMISFRSEASCHDFAARASDHFPHGHSRCVGTRSPVPHRWRFRALAAAGIRPATWAWLLASTRRGNRSGGGHDGDRPVRRCVTHGWWGIRGFLSCFRRLPAVQRSGRSLQEQSPTGKGCYAAYVACYRTDGGDWPELHLPVVQQFPSIGAKRRGVGSGLGG